MTGLNIALGLTLSQRRTGIAFEAGSGGFTLHLDLLGIEFRSEVMPGHRYVVRMGRREVFLEVNRGLPLMRRETTVINGRARQHSFGRYCVHLHRYAPGESVLN